MDASISLQLIDCSGKGLARYAGQLKLCDCVCRNPSNDAFWHIIDHAMKR